MTRNKLAKLKREWENMRRSPQKASDLISFAKRLGREKLPKSTKHPMWVNIHFPDLRPLSMPNHPGDMPPGTRNSILDQLEEDILKWELDPEVTDGPEGNEED